MIKVLNKTFDILEFVAREGDCSLSSISKAIGEKITTTSNIVQSLLGRDYLEKSGRGYKLGVMSYALTKNEAGYDSFLCGIAEAPMSALAAQTSSTAVLSVMRNKKRYAIMRIDGNSMIKINPEAFNMNDPCVSETGLLLLANQTDEVIDSVISENGVPEYFSDEEELRNTLAQAKERGYTTSIKSELYACAAPIFVNGRIVAAVGVYISKYRVQNIGDDDLLKGVLATAKEISAKAERIH